MHVSRLVTAIFLATCTQALSSADTPQKFDLACVGINRGIQDAEGNFTESKGLPESTRYRVKLVTGRWCEGKCKTVLPAILKSEFIVLLDESKLWARSVAFRWPAKSLIELSMLPTKLGLTVVSNFQCKPMPFSGIPT